ncbi:ThiF family [Carpediemonas membranifera]|uniref:NEDD8-activating enzyme E1 catalytic subunit n=1 Tax=Carpediemonas membranifera TaxID=201153 RepID=A0A8J6E2D6_9EUKA|nr:ThiF family [Carpediemonas membranifera]|eukprot:KAG9391777.1 ThiF family [Carpediemonas membranifera]
MKIKQRCTAQQFMTRHLQQHEQGEEYAPLIHQPILILGAGGLGCELLKDAAASGFTNIHVIDLDVIDLTNLNRQFLFTTSDIGRSKAEVAAKRIRQSFPHVKIEPHFCRMEELDEAFYTQFLLVIGGLDSVDARSWMNRTLLNLYRGGKVDFPVPFIDGGTEGFRGNARVIIPDSTPCFDCLGYLFPPQTKFPMCTIANTPRLPEHCIEFASQILFPREFDRPVDGDNGDDIRWVYNSASSRADKFGIQGVTFHLTLGVVKNVIPALATTNAIIAAVCTVEALKLVSGVGATLNNYVFYSGESFNHTVEPFAVNSACETCQQRMEAVTLPADITIAQWVTLMDVKGLAVTSLTVNDRPIWFSSGMVACDTSMALQSVVGAAVMDVTTAGKESVRLVPRFEAAV